MNLCAESFADVLTSHDFHFSTRELDDGRSVVTFPYDGRRTNFFFEGDNGDHVTMVTQIESVPEEKFTDVVLICNELNGSYKYLKFCVDKDNDVMVHMDAILDPSSAGEECMEMLARGVQILKEAKPLIMKGIYA